MKYKIIKINDIGNRSILIIYTGGTFGMIMDETKTLVPFNFGKVADKLPELKSLDIKLTVISFPNPIDSSNVSTHDWKNLTYIIEENYHQYDGFLILHGTDTMAYTASVLSFMLKGLNKPVILTGAQLPIGVIRSDARANLMTALEIAATHKNGHPTVSEVCIYFNYKLLRGNRSQKIRSDQFSAFESENYPYLATVGISIEFNHNVLRDFSSYGKLDVQYELNPNVLILKIFPGITKNILHAMLATKGLRGVVLESFGSGNTMNATWFIKELEEAIKNNVVILNISQCLGGSVIQGRYETSKQLDAIGVVNGGDLTSEAALAKMMLLIASEKHISGIKEKLILPMCGEMDSL